MCRRVSFATVLGRIRGVQAGRGFDGRQCLDECTVSSTTGAQRDSVLALGQMEAAQRMAAVKAQEPDSGRCDRHELAVCCGWCPGVLRRHSAVAEVEVAVVAAVAVAARAAGVVCRGTGHEGPAWRDPSSRMPGGSFLWLASFL
jgi:hypothetical protein